jgi:septum formation topological specificity factor MinE
VSVKAEDIEMRLERHDDLEVLRVKIELPEGGGAR